MSALRIGVDIGGTKTLAVVLDAAGEVIDHRRSPTGFGADAVVESAVTAISDLAQRGGIAPRDFASIGVGVPGRVDAATGHVAHAVNLGLESLDLGVMLGARIGSAVHVENDVNAAALGVHHLLGRPVTGSMAYLNLGTGLAAGFVLDGELWRGVRGVAGEIGHIPVDPAGELCPCGQRGCLETLASGSALARLWPEGDGAPAGALFDAAERGDERAVVVAARLVDNVTAAVRILVLTVDVDAVVIGGGLSSLGDRLIGGVRERLDAGARTSPFLASLDLGQRVLLAPPEPFVAAVGAALIAQRPVGSPLAGAS